MFTQILNSISMALASLASHKMRTLLTMLGIIIGVGSVITLTAIGEGASKAVADRIGSMGTNMLQIDPGPTNFGGVSSGGTGGSARITDKDVEAVRRSPLLTNVAPSVDTRAQVVSSTANWQTRIIGTTPECLKIRNYAVETGSAFTDADAANATKVCILGRTVANYLFGEGVDPIGRAVRVKQIPMTVIGVLKVKGMNAGGNDQDDIVIAPLATVEKKLMGVTWLDDIFASVVSESMTQQAIAEVRSIMRDRHKLQSGQDDDFRIRSQVEIAQTVEKTTDTLSLLLQSAAIVALLVGGIGIMNIMLVNVSQRTREIGIRKSIGAKRANILFQFLVEALTLSLIGGIIGIFGGLGASAFVSSQNGWTLIISPKAVALAFAAATAVGLFFGWYPARKAAAMDPIDALRKD
jgi:putative ABC transport system permease protein